MMDYSRIKDAFQARNIEFQVYQTREDLLDSLDYDVKAFKTFGLGNSQTLKELKICQRLMDQGKNVFDKTLGKSKDEIRKIKKAALLSECYISSSNAISEDGKIINVDHSGNRVAALTFGPDKVFIIVGSNKIAHNEQQGIQRALSIATPKNALRAGISSSCSIGKTCESCHQEQRVCNYVSIIRGQHEKGRMKILVLEEALGY